jgi:tRNA threonylcarbamoyl adenosine modification protein (Sua5/YciO/YrdC/YwlC family)
VSDPVADAVAALRAGSLVVFPTDTVYGIAAHPGRPGATERLFAAKGRPRDLELPVLAPDLAGARAVADLDPRGERLAVRFWPGALTLVAPRASGSAGWDLGGDPTTVGVRVPRHPLALAVLAVTGPLAVTSANRSGEPTPADGEDVVAVFGERVDVYLLDDAPLAGAASTVVDLAHGEATVLRAGALDPAEVLAVLRTT